MDYGRMGGHLIKGSTTLRSLVADLKQFTGFRSYRIVALMLLAGITEGIGLLMLLPMLALIGVFEASSGADPIAVETEKLFNGLGLPLNLYSVSVVFLALLAFRQWILFRQGNLVADVELKYANSIRHRLFEALQRANWRFVSRQRLSEYVHTLTQVSDHAGQAGYSMYRCIAWVILMCAQFIIAMMLAPILAILTVTSLSALLYLFGDRVSVLFASGRQVTEHRESVHAAISNFLALIRTSKFSGTGDYMGVRFRSQTRQLASEMAAYVRRFEVSRSTIYLAAATSLCIFSIFAVEVFAVSGARVLVLILIFARFIPLTMQLYQESHRLMHLLPAFEHAQTAIRDCLDHAEPLAHRLPRHPQPQMSIALENVTVVLGDDDSGAALNNVSVEFQAGTVTALVGPTGAGKSTLADVVSGLLWPDSGSLQIDGVALNHGEMMAWRKSVGYVAQNSVLMNDSVRQNLTWTTPGVTESDISTALKAAGADRFIAELPDGLETGVGEKGSRFSGGEQQRLAIARELLRRPQLLILDEATNALDESTAIEVIRSLAEFDVNMTVLLITHRESVAAVADCRVMLDQGRVVDVKRQFRVPAESDKTVVGAYP